jgi:hypothetical protein
MYNRKFHTHYIKIEITSPYQYNILYYHKTEMLLSLLPENTENYIKKTSDKCEFCKDKNNLVNTFYDNKIIKCCSLCNLVLNFDKSYSFYGFLCKTNLSQLDIIQKTKMEYKKTGNIPFLHELDKEAKKINVQSYLYSQFKNKLDYKFCFTNKICDIINDDVDDVFDVPKSKEKRNIMDYLKVEEYVFNEEEKKHIESEISEIRKNNYNLLRDKETDFLHKIKKIEKCK